MSTSETADQDPVDRGTPGDATDIAWMRAGRMALTGTITGGLGAMMGWRAFEDVCRPACEGLEVGMVGIVVAFAAVAAYAGARGMAHPCLGAAVGSSMLFALGVLHVAWAPLMTLHVGIVESVGIGTGLWFLWWVVVAILGILIWEGVHRATDSVTHTEHTPRA